MKQIFHKLLLEKLPGMNLKRLAVYLNHRVSTPFLSQEMHLMRLEHLRMQVQLQVQFREMMEMIIW